MAANTRSEAISGTNDVSETTDTLEMQLIQAAVEDPYLAALMTCDVYYINNYLWCNDCDVDQELMHGFTPLMIASLHGHFEAVELFVDAGADVNKTWNNKTALMLAANISSFELERVYTRWAVFNKTSKMGEDTLFTSSDSVDDKVALLERILENKTKIIECLLQAGADPNIRDKSGRGALIFVTENNLSKCLGSMFQGSVPVRIQTVANTELVKRCQCLIKYGVDINTTDSDRMTALMHAVGNRLDNVCELFLDFKANVDIVDNSENTALTYSVLTGSKHLSLLLLQRGAKLLTHDDLRRVIPSQDLLEKSCEICKLMLNGDDTNKDVTFWNILSAVCCRKAVRNQTQRTRSTSDYISNSLYPVTDNLNNDLGQAILLSAVTKKSFEVCKFALDHGANPNIKDNDDNTVMIHAILVRSVDICNLLLHHGADPNLSDAVGKTALMYAISQDLPEFANLLISSGADVNLQDVTGTTLLMYAITCKVDDCCQLLLRHGADVNMHNNIGRTALMFAASTNYDRGIQWLTENKADLNVQDVEGRTALMYAAMSNSTQSCKLLVENKADLNIQDEDRMTAVLYCAQKSLMDPLRVLLSGGANPDLCDNKEMSALMHTIVNNSPECCKLLVDHGADVNFQNSYNGETLVMSCFDRYFFTNDCLDILLTSKPDLNLMDKENKTALLKASSWNRFDICELLVCHGADVNIQDMMGISAMIYAVLGHSYKCVKYFLSLGVDPNENICLAYVPRDNNDGDVNVTLQDIGRGKSAFQLAVILDYKSLCTLMMSYGADVNKQDRDGRTALMYAVLHDSSECFPFLLECADLTVEDKEGRTVMSYATKAEYVQKLQQMGLEDVVTGEGEIVSVLSPLVNDVNFLTHLQKCQGGLDLYKATRQIDIVLENGASPILEPHERSLLHNILILRPINDYICVDLYAAMHSSDIQKCIYYKRNQLLRLLVCNGVVPASGSQSSKYCTVFQTVMKYGDKDIFKYLIANCYLTDQDVAYMRNPGRNARRRSIDYTLDDSDDNEDNHDNDYNDDNNNNMQVPEEMFQHPWPLVKLAFISVSTALGGGPGREARVSKTGLPAKLQDMFMFRQPAAQIPVREWEDIELCFDPDKYEKLPKPRPLLYYWPLGRQV